MYGKKKSKKESLMERLFKLKKGGRVKDEGRKKGKPSIMEQASMKRKKKKMKGYGGISDKEMNMFRD